MDIVLTYIKAFAVGGLFCVIGQVLIDRTKLTPARILTCYVVAGVILGALGLYQPLADWAGAGATVLLSCSVVAVVLLGKKAVAEKGFLGVFTGGFTASAAGICAAVFFGFIVAVIFKSRDKSK